MKLKSLLLGSAAALALSTGAQAADPISSFVSLDVCDAYGISGLTIASDDTCLKISGSVSYDFRWGDYRLGQAHNPYSTINDGNGDNDWRSRLEAVLKFEATTQTDAGAAKAVIGFRERDRWLATDFVGPVEEGSDHALRLQEAWVSFGDATVLMVGRKGSIEKVDNDAPFNYLGLFRSSDIDAGVNHSRTMRVGGTSIQVVSEVADGISVGAALESLADDFNEGGNRGTGTFVGFVEAKGGWGSAHATVYVNNILNNVASEWAIHTGATFNFDNFKVRAALAADDSGFWNGLLSGEAAFDLFTLAASTEFTSNDELGFGASAGFQATDDIKINLGFRYLDSDTTIAGGTTESWQAALQVVATLTETITATGAVGVYGGGTLPVANDPVAYVDLGVDYNPGGGFKTGAGVNINALGAYEVRFNASKSF